MFGPEQRAKYGALILQALEWVARDPAGLGSKSRPEIQPGLRSFHIERAAMRRGAASHVLYYGDGPMSDGIAGVIVFRVLHERMEPGRHLSAGLD